LIPVVGALLAAPLSESSQAASGPKTIKLPVGSYVIRMDQPYSRMVDML